MFAAKDSLLTRPSGGYQISRSLRFNSADSAYLARTPSTTTNRRTFTFSAWVKLSKTSDDPFLMGAGAGGQIWLNGDKIRVRLNGSPDYYYDTSAVFRDYSAWYHIVVGVDTTNATSADRVKIYVNSTQQAIGASSAPPQNFDTEFNLASTSNNLGKWPSGSQYLNGYMTEINFIDGQALTPSSFGQTDAQTGVWKPKAYSGSYGTNGFYLNFSDNSNTTAATLGKDYSGNGNNWTPNNFSVTAGAGNDSLVDSPTSYGTDTGVGGTVRGNYCTLNPLTTTTGTYTQSNLRYVGANQDRRSNATISVSTGQWYWEVTLANAPQLPRTSSSLYNAFGFGLSTVFNSTTSPPLMTDALVLGDNGFYKNFSGAFTNGGVTFVSGDVLSVAVDLDANTFTFRVNNTSLATGTIGGTAGRELVPFIFSYNGDYGIMDCNFGQRPFAYTAPSGYKALCTQNLPTPTIGATTATQAGKYFNPVLYTGTGATNSITGVGFQPDWVWVKGRSGATDHGLYDAVRGVQKQLESNGTGAETTETTGITAFGSDGFTTGALAQLNTSSATYVAWNWKANGSGSTNTAGSITSTVSANTTSGFSVLTYTGTGSAATIGHGLGVAPSMLIFKSRSNSSENWNVYHRSLGTSNNILLNTTGAAFNDTAFINNTAPTSSVLSVGGAGSTGTNQGSGTYVCYAFAPIAGYSAFGSFTGNGSTDGAFVYTGFRPAFVMLKASSTGGAGYNWGMFDNDRLGYNSAQRDLRANLINDEGTDNNLIDFLSNGFKIRSTSGGFGGGSGVTYIYMAFAENPFKYSLAR